MNGLLFVRRQLSEVQVGGIPYFHVLRMKSLQRDGAIDKLPHGSNVPSSTARQRLNHNITDSRSRTRYSLGRSSGACHEPELCLPEQWHLVVDGNRGRCSRY